MIIKTNDDQPTSVYNYFKSLINPGKIIVSIDYYDATGEIIGKLQFFDCEITGLTPNKEFDYSKNDVMTFNLNLTFNEVKHLYS